MRLMPVRARVKKSRLTKDWNGIIQAAEDGLSLNPWDATLNADLGEALRESGYLECAVFAWERAVKYDPSNREYLRQLGRLLEERGEFDRAIECFSKVMKLDPLDSEARAKITELQASKTMRRGGYEDEDSTRKLNQLATGKGASNTADSPGMSVEADMTHAIRKDPNNKDHYIKLADYYRREGNLEKCEETLNKIIELTGGDIKFREQLEDVQLDRMRTAVGHVREIAQKRSKDETAAEKFKEMDKELLLREIEVYSARSERYPQDMRVKFELGLRLMRVKKHAQAIPLFQKARGDNRFKTRSLLNLGKCFITEKQLPLARRQFEQGATEVDRDQESDLLVEMRYYAGRVCEELKDFSAAIQHYQVVIEIDYDYKDAKDRLSQLESGGTSATK